MNNTKPILAILFALMLIPMSTLAFSGGSGTQGDPYLISSLSDWQQIQTEIDAGEYGGSFSGAPRNLYYQLTNDVDLGGYSLDGSSGAIFGIILDGDGYTLTTSSSSGLLGSSVFPSAPTSGDNIIQFENLTIHADNVATSQSNYGLIAGAFSGNSVTLYLDSVSFTGVVTGGAVFTEMGSIVGQYTAGGATGTISNVQSNVTLSSQGDAGGYFSNLRNMAITKSIYHGVVSDANTPSGIADDVCCGATGTSVFFDSNLNPSATANVGTPLTTAQMTDIAEYDFNGYDITTGLNSSFTWGIDPSINDGYAFLQVLNVPEPLEPIPNALISVDNYFDETPTTYDLSLRGEYSNPHQEYGFLLSTSPNVDVNNYEQIINNTGEVTNVSFGTFNNLNKDVTYYLKAYAISTGGAGYSSEINFSLPSPEVLTQCNADFQCDGYGNATCLIDDTSTASCNSTTDVNSCTLETGAYCNSPQQDGANYARNTRFEVTDSRTISEIQFPTTINVNSFNIIVYDSCSNLSVLSSQNFNNEYLGKVHEVNISVQQGNCLEVNLDGGTTGVELIGDFDTNFLSLNETFGTSLCNNVFSSQPRTDCVVAVNMNTQPISYEGDFSEFANQTGICDYCTPNFVCDDYGNCSYEPLISNFTQSCTNVTDTNSCYETTGLLSDSYLGDGSEFALACTPDEPLVLTKPTVSDSTNSTLTIESAVVYNESPVTSFFIVLSPLPNINVSDPRPEDIIASPNGTYDNFYYEFTNLTDDTPYYVVSTANADGAITATSEEALVRTNESYSIGVIVGILLAVFLVTAIAGVLLRSKVETKENKEMTDLVTVIAVAGGIIALLILIL